MTNRFEASPNKKITQLALHLAIDFLYIACLAQASLFTKAQTELREWTLEAEKKFFQEDLARLKAEAAKLQQQIDKAKKRQHEFEVLRQHEEREKIKHLQKAESIRREREEMKQKTKMEEEKLITKAEEERVKYEERMKEIKAQISAIKLGESSSGKAEAKKRERECVMCLNLDKTVVLLPCAHLVLCEECNELHQRMGMKECPTCRTPIMQRIRVRFPHPKAMTTRS
ncbi:putative E3 ubiquitin-protein ligase RF4 [Ipomoea triloba]|uniref:putative E3 ubiquitin-protein ligase RF4 n=1 Tax=Ipomoea triloba TaxID=35885 RepID=UPI00125DB3E0|nr:putative E3 ubiquitin-protein ligase RF4 [Ipomoea triloba]